MSDTKLIHSGIKFDHEANCYDVYEVIILNVKIKSKDNYFLFGIHTACAFFGYAENALKSAKEMFFHYLTKLANNYIENNVEKEFRIDLFFNLLKNSYNFLCELDEKLYSRYAKHCSQHVITLQ